MKTRTLQRCLSLLLVFVMVLSVVPITAHAAETSTVVIAGSDFQAANDTESAKNVTSILNQIKKNYSAADGFLFAGDYSTGSSTGACESGLNALKGAVSGSGLGITHEVFAQGNHDRNYGNDSSKTGLSKTGANDAADYGVFTIGLEDYDRYSSYDPDGVKVKAAAAQLKTYLDGKAAEHYSKPIFVISHVPLHYTTRVASDGGGMYANRIFDVVNEAAKTLNIIYMFGHNHNGPDAYLGNSCVYLGKGDSIEIAQNSKSVHKTETLNFTYMNAGYTGNATNGYDNTLTMSVFEITGNEVKISRYDANGMHANLQCMGKNYSVPSGMTPDTTPVSCPQTIMLDGTETPENPVSITPPANTNLGKLAIGDEITLTADTGALPVASVKWESSNPAVATVTDGAATSTLKAAGAGAAVITVTVTEGSAKARAVGDTYTATLNVGVAAPAPAETTYTKITDLSQIVSGGQYLIMYGGTDGGDQYDLISGGELAKDVPGDYKIARVETNLTEAPDILTEPAYEAHEWNMTGSSGKYVLAGPKGVLHLEQNNAGFNGAAGETHNITVADANNHSFYVINDAGYGFSGSSSHYFKAYQGDAIDPVYIYKKIVGDDQGQSDGWVDMGDGTEGTSETVYQLTETFASGKKYLIVSSNTDGSANALRNNSSTIAASSVTIELVDGKPTIKTANADTVWTNNNGKLVNNNRYLRSQYSNRSYAFNTARTQRDGSTWSYDAGTNGLNFNSGGRNHIINYSSSKFTTSNSSNNRVYIYEETTIKTEGTPGSSAKLDGTLHYAFLVDVMTEADIQDMVRGGITVTFKDKNGNETLVTNYELRGTVDPSTPGNYRYEVYYDGHKLGHVAVKILENVEPPVEVTIENVELTSDNGWSYVGNTLVNNTSLTITYSDGTTETVPVTQDMLSGEFNGNTVGTYTGLTVTYEDEEGTVHTFPNFTLEVRAKSGGGDGGDENIGDYPEYPHPGAVKVGKEADTTTTDFRKTGVARVDLSTSGLPIRKGVDVVIVLDSSSSMKGGSDTALKNAVDNLITTLKRPADGQTAQDVDIDFAIVDFNDYDLLYAGINGGDKNIVIDGTSADRNGEQYGMYGILTGPNGGYGIRNRTASLDAFEKIKDTTFQASTRSDPRGGTNYDYGLTTAYQLLKLKKEANQAAGDDREQFVIFMSDGMPYQYNYFSNYGSGSNGKANWEKWLRGENTAAPNTDSHLFNGQSTLINNATYQPHRYAEAIKGSPNDTFGITNPNNPAGTNGQAYLDQVNGLGATVYSIGFNLDSDGGALSRSLLAGIASEESKFIDVNNADALNDAFQSIASDLKIAGTNAKFIDKMGGAYNLQMAKTFTPEGKTDPITVPVDPTITVAKYDVYKEADVDGVNVTEDMIGTRKSDTPKEVLETVTFNADGTEAYSSINPGVNILTDKKINAQNFTYDLTTETFEWRIGNITEDEICLSYYVYLTGSMEGTREQGSYDTNEFADLNYTNWRGKTDAERKTTSPTLPWGGANVSVGFYLVNEQGQVVVNQAENKTGTFANKIAVTQPYVYSTVLLNNNEMVSATIAAKDVLPEGYSLYESNPNYTVTINSDDTGSWVIVSDQGKETTYVTDFGYDNGKNYSNAKNSGTVNQGKNDYTHTTVWFAVVCTVSPVPDAVVIDFGLPVDISVLGNDIILGVAGQGKIVGVGPAIEFAEGETYKKTATLDEGYAQTLTLPHGEATVLKDEVGNVTGEIRYTPTNMTFGTTDVFSYAVEYTGKDSKLNGIYYTNVKVIPATNIYYEDKFVTLANGTNNNGQDFNVWTQDGKYLDGTQAEDRPGKWNLSDFDANNVYGYDPAYDECRTFSMGSAAKVTVTNKNKEGVWPTATFTFTGTGFDLTAVSSNTVGAIFLELYEGTEATGTPVLTWFVDQYYGYSMVNGEWVITPDTANALYQIPVISRHGLKYGTYTAVVTPKFASGFAHGRTQYDFYMDAVRVYDPGLNDNDANDAHDKDNEGWPQIMEIRDNLIAAEDFDVTQAGTTFVWIDGKNTGSLDEFEKYGPKNEVYLISNQAVAFRLNAIDASKIASIQIGAKAPNSDAGETASLYVNGKLIKELTTATNMYYDITTDIKWNGNTSEPIVIHTGENDNILSLTDIKITFTDAPAGSVQIATDEETVQLAMAMMAPPAPDPDPTEPEPTEPEPTEPEPTEPEPTDPVFEPEIFEISLKKDSVKAGQTAVVTVTTSADVARVTLDGADMNRGKVDKKTGLVTWSYEITMEEAGEHTFTAVAYNEEGIAAEELQTATITVADNGNGKDNGKGNQKETTEEAESEVESVSEPETEPAETEPAIVLETEPAETESETQPTTEPHE